MAPKKKSANNIFSPGVAKNILTIIITCVAVGTGIFLWQLAKEKRAQDEFQEKTLYAQDVYLEALRERNREKKQKLLKIPMPNPDTNEDERAKLFLKLVNADSISSCFSIAHDMANLGPSCSESFGSFLCHNSGQEYRDYMISCIGNLAVRQGKKELCADGDLTDTICKEWGKLMLTQENLKLDEPSPECVKFIRDSCILSFDRLIKTSR